MLEEVLVLATPIRDSQQASIDAKRLSDNSVEIVSADTIGQFPDQNLADSLGRLPGIAIERDQGQARYINLRGAPFRYTTIAFDGIDVPGAENGRIPRFDSFPSVITQRIEANKAILPSMPGESVAGFINIHTFSPFAKDGLSFSADIGAGKQNLGNGDIDKMAFRGSWSNENFGGMIFASENSRNQITDGRGYELDRTVKGELTVQELDFTSYKIRREDKSYGGRIEYRGNNALQRVFLSNLYSEFQDRERRNQFIFSPLSPAVGANVEDVSMLVSRRLQDGIYENSTETSTLGADVLAGNWIVEGRLTATETISLSDIPIPFSVGGVTLADYNLNEIDDPKVYLAGDLSQVQYARDIGIHYVERLNIDATQLKIDASRDLSIFGYSSTLSLGVKWDDRDADGYVGQPIYTSMPSGINIDSYNTGKPWDANKTNTIGGTYYDNSSLVKDWSSQGDLSISGQIAPENKIFIEEEILSAYAMIRSEFSWGSIVAGLRIEETEYSSEGNVNDLPVSAQERFINYLPSAHVNIDLAEDLKWRISASTGVNRPNYNEWRAAVSVNLVDEEVTGGNPRLQAEEAIGFDTSLEWYFAPASLLSAGAFYREIDNVIYTDVSTIDAGLYWPPAAGQTWEYFGAVNGNNGMMKGIEFNAIALAEEVLPSPFDGLGISANLTFLDSEFETLDGRVLSLPGTSDTIYNASLFYEKYDFSIRLNYQYRDDWVSPVQDPSDYWGEQERVDLSIVYDLPINWDRISMSVYANFNNLTDETDRRYSGNDTINQSEEYGRRYLLGFRVNY
ncbi:TonB-dependent receptor [Parahaliea mediterranea]|uniref:TonB-dependent receptor n=1 Tax=Parahaliea mediterranea TaxID=651086 RepID=UPI0013007EB1|nr:TonB-dependent receptor [Parahaliea mediterranea]